MSERHGQVSRFYHGDLLGSARGLSDSGEAVTDGRLFDAFGMTLSRWGDTNMLLGFAASSGYQTDEDSGFQLLGHRFYDPSIGRFITQDPAKSGNNWYAYVGNNPLSFVDPSGLTPSLNSDALWRQNGNPDILQMEEILARADAEYELWRHNLITAKGREEWKEHLKQQAEVAGQAINYAVGSLFDALFSTVGLSVGSVQPAPGNKTPNIQSFETYEQARNAALKWLKQNGFKAEKPTTGRLGPNVGKPVGMSTADKKVGFRIEWDKTNGPHINVFNHNAPKLGIDRNLPHFTFKGDQSLVNKIIKQFSR